jgi:hypothetical protein
VFQLTGSRADSGSGISRQPCEAKSFGFSHGQSDTDMIQLMGNASSLVQ